MPPPSLFSPSADLGKAFPYLLASQYLLAGVGSVLGVLTAAFTATVVREIRRGRLGRECDMDGQ